MVDFRPIMKLSFENIVVVVMEEWFSEMNSTDSDIFPKTLVNRKRTKLFKNIIYVKQSNTFSLLQLKMAVTCRLFRCCVKNSMVNFIHLKINLVGFLR